MESFFSSGFNACFRDIDDEQWIQDNNRALEKIDHQPATKRLDTLQKNIKKYVECGYQFPCDPGIINTIPNSVSSPYVIATQNTFNELLKIILKYRTDHDLIIEKSPDGSFNSRLMREKLPDVIHGFYLLHFLPHLHSLRLHGPTKK